MKLNIRMTESYETFIVRASLEIDTKYYPQLEGLSEQEVIDYISENGDDMEQTNPDGYYSSLREELMDQDVVRDKVYNEDTAIQKAN